MASTKDSKGDAEDWEYEDEEAEDYEWEYSEGEEPETHQKNGDKEEEENIPLEDQELPDPFSSTPLQATTKKETYTSNDDVKSSNGDRKKHRSRDENGEKKHRRKKSKHLDRIDTFSKKNGGDSELNRTKKIHVRSKDPSRIARQFEKNAAHPKGSKSRKDVKRPLPPQQKVNQICKICDKEPYLVERIVAEKSWWHKNCFKCHQCKKVLNLDAYVSHEGIIYCKAHHRELFQPKAVKSDIIEITSNAADMTDVVQKHQEQARRMETIIRESNPVELSDVVKCNPDGEKYAGLEHLDVGSKFKMFESGNSAERSSGMGSSDRYGIMEKLKRLQDGEELEDLLAEIDEELPSSSEEEDEVGMTNVQKKMHHAEKLFEEGGQDRKAKLAEERKKELKSLRKKLAGGTRDSIMREFDDIMLQKDSKIKKTKVDVRSENAKKFRDMFDKGEVPEAVVPSDKSTYEKNQELEQMRKKKREQLEFFKQMEEGKLEEKSTKPKLLVGKIKHSTSDDNVDDMDEAEMSLSNKFTFFEHFEEKQEEMSKKGKKPSRLSPSRWNQGNEEDEDPEETRKYMSETEIAKRECKARSVLNKFKDMEQKALNGEDDVKKLDDPDKPVMTALGFLGRLPGVGDRPRLKQFTPPRRHGSDSESEYSDSEYTDSYTDDSDYSCSESEEEDETLRAIRAAARAKELRAKFEEWEESSDAKDQIRQMMIHDENGESLETASNLKARFESFNLGDEKGSGKRPHFQIKRFK